MLSFFGRNTPCKRQAQCYYTNWKTTTLRVLLLVEFFLLLTTTANAASSSSTTRTSEHHHHHRLEYIHRVPCPTDKSLLGYTSIESLNLEIKRHKSLVVPPILSPPHAQYTYRLCPHTRYLDASTTSLTPFLDHTHILCGRNGDVNDHCVLEGDGSGPQVLLVDTLPIQPRVVVLEGITFEQTTTTASTTTASGYSEHYSIAAVASNQMRAEFLHCHWKNAQRVLLISHAISVAVPFQNPDVTFAFDTTMNNIFDHRRRRRRRSAELSQEQDILDDGRLVEYSPTKSMSVSLLDCIIEGAPKDDPDTTITSSSSSIIYNQGYLELTNVNFSNLHAADFIVDTVQGGHVTFYRTTFFQNSCVALIRGIYHSNTLITKSQFIDNQAEYSVTIVDDSTLTLEWSLFESSSSESSSSSSSYNDTTTTTTTLVDVLVLEESQIDVQHSCLQFGILVDSSSQLVEETNNYMAAAGSSSSSSSPQQKWCSRRGGHVLQLVQDDATFLECFLQNNNNDDDDGDDDDDCFSRMVDDYDYYYCSKDDTLPATTCPFWDNNMDDPYYDDWDQLSSAGSLLQDGTSTTRWESSSSSWTTTSHWKMMGISILLFYYYFL